jgi:hypothetical protein
MNCLKSATCCQVLDKIQNLQKSLVDILSPYARYRRIALVTLTKPAKLSCHNLGLLWLSPPSLLFSHHETQQGNYEVFAYNTMTTEMINLPWPFIRL